MYNIYVKYEFIDTLTADGTKTIYTSLFNRSAKAEKRLNKDVYSFNLNECMELLNELNPKSVGNIRSFKSQFHKYTDWAILNKLTARNYWILVPTDDDWARYAFKQRHIKDLNELQNIVEQTFIVPYDKYVIYLLYMGIMGEGCVELTQIKDEDVNKLTGVIKTPRRQFTAVKPLHDLIKFGEYYQERKPRDEDSIYFIKPYLTFHRMGMPINSSYVYNTFTKLNKATDERRFYTPYTVWQSGMFFELYTAEREKDELRKEDITAVCEKYGRGELLVREYELYKDVFWNGA